MSTPVRWKFIGSNYLENFSFESEDISESGLASQWVKVGTPTLSLSKTSKKHNIYSQKIVSATANHGISQIIDVSERVTDNFAFIFYAYILSGTLNLKIEALDSNEVVLGTVYTNTYTSNALMTKQTGTFTVTVSAETITYLKVSFLQSGATAMTAYIDASMVYEDLNTTTEINPTTVSFNKKANTQFTEDIEGNEITINHIEEAKRTKIDSLPLSFMYLSPTQLNIFLDLVGKEVILIDHEDAVYCVSILEVQPSYLPYQVPQTYSAVLTIKESKRY